MKIIYLALCNNKRDGVFKKIAAQHRSICKIMPDSKTYLISSNNGTNSDMEFIEVLDNLYLAQTPIEKNKSNIIYDRKAKMDIMKKIILKNEPKETIVYMRYPIADPFFFKMLCDISDYKVITEHQEKERYASIFIKKPIRYFSELLYGKKVRDKLYGMVSVTKEIEDYEKKVSKKKADSFWVIGNGIEVESIPLREPPRGVAVDGLLKILFVGSGYIHHGLDRLFKGLKNAGIKENGLKIKITIAGGDCGGINYLEMANRMGIENQIEVVGHKDGLDYDKLFNNHDIAAGSLALHRNGMKEATTLKAREYCARGIPFFCSEEDMDFREDFPYRLKCPTGDTPIDIQTVYTFAKRVLSDSNHHFIMRSYAKEVLDWGIKIKKLENLLAISKGA